MINLHEPNIGKEEKKILSKCIDSGWISSSGKYLDEFVDSLNKYTNQYKFAKRYGQIIETRHPVVFWFEKNKKVINLPKPIESD